MMKKQNYFAVYKGTSLESEHRSMTAAAKAAYRLQSKSRAVISIQNYDGNEIKNADWESLAEGSIYESEVEYYKRNPNNRKKTAKRTTKKKAARRATKKTTVKRGPAQTRYWAQVNYPKGKPPRYYDGARLTPNKSQAAFYTDKKTVVKIARILADTLKHDVSIQTNRPVKKK
jgi:hypothetical protein